MPKKPRKEEKPLTPEQVARRAAGIAASEQRRKAKAAEKAAANGQAEALAKWTGDKCPELLAGEIQQEFLDLNAKITAKLDIFTSKAADAKLAFDDLIPDLDIMQAMLSQRGRYRKLMNTLGLPTWTGWFKGFQKHCALEYSYKTIQRRLKDYRAELGEEPKPEPSIYEDLFKRLNALVPSWSDGVEHVLVDRLDTITSRIVDNHGDGLTELEKNYLNYSITTLEEIAKDFTAYAAAIKDAWTGREQWLREKEEDKQRRFAALKGEAEESKSEIRTQQDETLATSSRSTSEDHAQEPSNPESDTVAYWVPPASPPKIKGGPKMRAREKLEAARAAGCIYCVTHSSARSCPTHGWKEKRSMASRSYMTHEEYEQMKSKLSSQKPKPFGDDCVGWLHKHLSEGPVLKREALSAGCGAGFNRPTTQEAAKKLNVHVEGIGRECLWSLPTPEPENSSMPAITAEAIQPCWTP